ncbi:hypothetical protein PIB30_091332 [Stylosanthes scabra]|uniref:Uncharacterized protein n=1 Tax=Stylosanthes scabra TaxID=79078 RepID=A0ABU6ZTU0_9FABA|nr:hypothetical protein [Stylosanthes scabra]
MHHLRLREALFTLYVSIPPLSSDKGHESPPIWLNEEAKERGRKGDSKLEDVLRTMGMEVVLGCSMWSGGTAYVCVSLESRYGLGLVKPSMVPHERMSRLPKQPAPPFCVLSALAPHGSGATPQNSGTLYLHGVIMLHGIAISVRTFLNVSGTTPPSSQKEKL